MSFSRGSIFACNPNPTRLVSVKLSSDPTGEKIVYVNGRTVVIRDLNNPSQSVTYSEHTQQASAARISPSGYYCASADVAGNVRVWDIAGTDQSLKLTTKPLGGRINDLAWDGESKRIIVAGDGRERFGASFFVDSGSSCGEIQGHSQVVNAVSIRHQRPFRAVTASDDGAVVFYTGVPFKYEKTLRNHSKFVQDVRYSASGDHFASVGSDGKLFVYDGKDANVVSEVDASKGTIMACSWSPDSKALSTAAADGTVKLWDIETKQAKQTFEIGSDVNSQQNGTVWAQENVVVSVGLDGTLHVLDPRTGKATRQIHGATKAVTAGGASLKPEPTFYTGSFDGSIRAFSLPDGECAPVSGNATEGQISGFASDREEGKAYATSWTAGAGLMRLDGREVASDSRADAPIQGSKGISASGGLVAVVDNDGVSVFKDGSRVKHVAGANLTSVALHDNHLAYGSADKKIRLATITGEDSTTFDDSRGEVISLAFSPDGKLLAGGDTSGRIVLIDVQEKKVLVGSKWTAHTSRVASQAFSPDNLRIASGGLDESVYIWSVKRTLKNLPIKNAHAGGVTAVDWQDDETVVSAGADACIRTWKVSGI